MQIFQTEIAKMIDMEHEHNLAWDYYEGGVPEFFATPALRRAVRSTVRNIGLNHSRTVVKEMLNRLEINAITGQSQPANKILKTIVEENQLDVLFDDLFEKASVYGEAFAIAWPDLNAKWRISTHSPKSVYVKYSVENPWEMEFALKVWQDGDQVRLNAFYPDRIEKYVTTAGSLSFAQNWDLVQAIDNPFGEIPVFHLRNNLNNGRPEHKDSYSCQDAINKLVITQLYTVDYQGAPQRYALSQMDNPGEAQDFDTDTEREKLEGLNADPGELWYLRGVNQVGEFTAAEPNVFWDPIKDFTRSMASLTGTPLHYFETNGSMPSGQALRAAEAPLLTKVKKRRNAYTVPLKSLFEFILKAEGVARYAVEIKWADLESMDVMEEWDLTLKKINSGLPLKQVLIEAGYTEEEIKQIIAWKVEQVALMGETDYQRTDDNGNKTTQRKPVVRVQEDNNENNVESGGKE